VNDQTDSQLLRAYAEQRAEPAFAELVRRHVDLVYSAALRMVCDAHLAQDVTQGVFVALAKQASQLAERPVLAGWLHGTAKNIAAQAVRTDVRRRAREQEAATMNELLAGEPEIRWEQIAPQLDTALAELNELDRDALMLRYFERKSAHEIAQILGLSDEAAQKRVSRAAERLRDFFSKRNVTIGASGLVVLISANAVQSAPIGLAATVSAAAILTGATISTSATIAATKTIAMTTKTLITAALIVTVGAGIFEAHQIAQLRKQNQILQQQQAPLAGQIRQLQADNESLSNRFAEIGETKKLPAAQFNELLKLRGQIGVLQSAIDDPAEKAAKAWVARVNFLKQKLQKNPAVGIPEFQFLKDEDWLAAVKNNNFDSEADYRRAFSTLRNTAEDHFANPLNAALQKYIQANNRQFPTDLNQLQPYFDSPIDDDILQRWEITSAQTAPNMIVSGSHGSIITQKTAVDDLLDTRIVIGSSGFGSTDFLQTETVNTLKPVYNAFNSAKGTFPSDLSQLLPYATTPEQQAAIQKLIEQKSLR
jgi:RNA polymerase sigma factor (sigma-70 family)